MKIDYQSPTPYYAQLAAILRTTIKSQESKPGTRLLSEAELEQTYRVSRTVVRQALGLLTSEGLVYRRKGRGTFVAEPKYATALVQTLASFYDEMAARGHPPVSQLLVQRREVPPGAVSSVLRLGEGAQVIKLVRLRFVEDEPVVLNTSYLPYDLCPELLHEDLSRVSLYGVLEGKYGLTIASGVRRIEAAAAGRADARLLRIRTGHPLLVVQSTTYLGDGRPVDFSIAKHRADRTCLEAYLLRTHPAFPMTQGTAAEAVASAIDRRTGGSAMPADV